MARTWLVVAITAVTMVAEIVGGWLTGSMALLADGWHMGTHVAALAMAGIAYALARRWSRDDRFAFGTWKIEVLGAFSSALVLALVALAMAVESVIRLVEPRPIDYGVALAVAVVGLAVNVVSAESERFTSPSLQMLRQLGFKIENRAYDDPRRSRGPARPCPRGR